MDPIKVQAITDWPTPTNLSELRSFLGFGNYYKDFIPKYLHVTQPLHNLTKKDALYYWGPAHGNAFKLLKDLFSSYPVLWNPDPTKPYRLDTDTSQYAEEAILSQ
jgi:hypothetical protein